MKGAKRKLSVLGFQLSLRDKDELEDKGTTELPDEIPLGDLFKMGWKFYEASEEAFRAFNMNYKDPEEYLRREVVKSLQDLRRYLRVISMLLRKGGNYYRKIHEVDVDNEDKHDEGESKSKGTEGKKSKNRVMQGNEEEFNFLDEDDMEYEKLDRNV